MRRRQTVLLTVLLCLVLVAGIVLGVTARPSRADTAVPTVAAESALPAAPSALPSETAEPSAEADPAAVSADPDAAAPGSTDAPTATPRASVAPDATPTPAAPDPTPTPAAETCTLSITCGTALASDALSDAIRAVLPADGQILYITAELQDGDTVWSVLQRACRERGVALEANWTPAYNTAYVQGIGHLYEFDCGQGSGWIFSVNGTVPGVGCSSYTVQPGDVIRWMYTCDYGNDV